MNSIFASVKTPAMEMRLTERMKRRKMIFDLYIKDEKIEEFTRSDESFTTESLAIPFSYFINIKAEHYIDFLDIYFTLDLKGEKPYMDGAIDAVAIERKGSRMIIALVFYLGKSIYNRWNEGNFYKEMKKRIKSYKISPSSDFDVSIEEGNEFVIFEYHTTVRNTLGELVQEGVNEVSNLVKEVDNFFDLTND